jgi:hypothetical protein
LDRRLGRLKNQLGIFGEYKNPLASVRNRSPYHEAHSLATIKSEFS